MVLPAAAADRVLLEGTPARGGLPRVEDRRPGPRDRGDEPRRQRRDAAEPLEEVQGGALHRQERPHRAGDPRDDVPGASDRRRPGAAASRRRARTARPAAPTTGSRRDAPRPRHEPGRPRTCPGIVAVGSGRRPGPGPPPGPGRSGPRHSTARPGPNWNAEALRRVIHRRRDLAVPLRRRFRWASRLERVRVRAPGWIILGRRRFAGPGLHGLQSWAPRIPAGET